MLLIFSMCRMPTLIVHYTCLLIHKQAANPLPIRGCNPNICHQSISRSFVVLVVYAGVRNGPCKTTILLNNQIVVYLNIKI